MSNNYDIRLLNDIYMNSRIGMNATDILLYKTDDLNLIGDMNTQRANYLEIAKKATQQLLDQNSLPDENSHMSRCVLWMSIQCNTMFNKSTKHISDMLIAGSQMGIKELNEFLARNPQVQQQTIDLANELIALEQGSIEKLSAYKN